MSKKCKLDRPVSNLDYRKHVVVTAGVTTNTYVFAPTPVSDFSLYSVVLLMQSFSAGTWSGSSFGGISDLCVKDPLAVRVVDDQHFNLHFEFPSEVP